jgi:hypothetical protein
MPLDLFDEASVLRLALQCSPLTSSKSSQLSFPSFEELPSEPEVELDLRYYTDPADNFVVMPAIHWCFLGEIIRDDSIVRRVLLVKDRTGYLCRVAFYLDDESSFDTTKCMPGHTICIMYAHQRVFFDMSQGIRIEDGSAVEVRHPLAFQ